MKNFIHITCLIFILSSCASYENFKRITQDLEIPQQVFKSSFTETWLAVIQVMRKYDISQQNQETGFIKTRWMDNTLELNFTDSFGSNDSIKAAKFKLILNVTKGYSFGKEVSKVTVYRRQLIEKDFLQGWKELPSDGTQEKVLLYRISKVLENNFKIKKIDKLREQEQLESF